MRTYVIFDCHTLSTDGDMVVFAPRFVANAFAVVLTWVTGRMYDYAFAAQEWEA